MKKESKIKIFLTIFLILTVFTLIFNRFLFKVKEFLDEKFLPIQSKIYTTAGKISNTTEAAFLYKDILKENEKLKRENMELKLINSANEIILDENERLVKLLEMKETNKKIRNLKFARVAFRDINNINSKFYVDLGSNDGIERNMIVIYNDNLIGRVSEVYQKNSLVTMITDGNSRISVRSSSNLLGIAQGSDTGDNSMYFHPSTFEESLEVGEEILTSGLSEIYPEGLKLGKIEEINKSENNIFKSIKIKPEFSSKDLREVMIYKYEN
ncbi:rod shape-determining protein MreC [Fusobacterium sp.]|uniref:rod shape-determining protein MreC n=1 Tax=Fusobacterium sp. TaxID=68766 RepID=UPI0025C6B690|nr:rod shape-determining protein MreC [Fusobacterium sp.]MCI7223263.1 rod shape-determining protein MreC [Fusobacterium sp.]